MSGSMSVMSWEKGAVQVRERVESFTIGFGELTAESKPGSIIIYVVENEH